MSSLAVMVNHAAVKADNATSSPASRSRTQAPGFKSNSWSLEDLYPILTGLLMALSIPPMNLSFLAMIALVPLFLYLDQPFTFKRAVRAGLLTGTLYFGIGISWLNAVGTFSWLAFPAYVLGVLLHVANFFFFVLAVVGLKNYLSWSFLYTAPFAWVACERLRGYGDVAFPWTPFGYALTHFPFLLQFADIVGIYGVSFWLVLLNVLLFEAIRVRGQPARWGKYAISWLLVFGCVNLYNAVRWFRGVGPPSGYVQVAVVQPNVPQRIKWDERYSRQILKKLFALNATATLKSTELVVWPETAIPYYIDESRPFNLTEMGELPQENARILTGLLFSSRDGEGRTHFYNGAALFDPHGVMLSRYRKIYLVPGSELYPFRRLLGFTRSFFNIQDISYGAMDPGDESTVFTLPEAKFSVMICYESAFPQLSRAFRLAGSNFLVNITNDAWFGRSFAPYQHASFLVVRAIESRAAIVRCGNTGISGFIDPLGRWQQKTTLDTGAILVGKIPLTQRLTLYTRLGDVIVYISYAVLGLLLVLVLKKRYSVSLHERKAI